MATPRDMAKNVINIPAEVVTTWPKDVQDIYKELLEAHRAKDKSLTRKFRAELRARGIKVSTFSKSRKLH